MKFFASLLARMTALVALVFKAGFHQVSAWWIGRVPGACACST